MVGVAVNVTLVPVQIILSTSFEAMLTLTGRFGFTVTGILLLVTIAGVAQVADDVRSNVIISLFERAEEVNELVFVPTAIPFNRH